MEVVVENFVVGVKVRPRNQGRPHGYLTMAVCLKIDEAAGWVSIPGRTTQIKFMLLTLQTAGRLAELIESVLRRSAVFRIEIAETAYCAKVPASKCIFGNGNRIGDLA